MVAHREWECECYCISHRMISKKEEFNRAAEEAKILKTQPEKNEVLQIYSLYKQSTVGDVNISRSARLV